MGLGKRGSEVSRKISALVHSAVKKFALGVYTCYDNVIWMKYTSELHKGKVSCKLKRPVCAEVGSRVTISRMVGQRWRLIGFGIINK